ncbi:MAG: PAS domain S-box protein [Thermodesulfobacteriota bacterium]
MQNLEQIDSFEWNQKLLWIGILFCCLYWFLESALHVFIFKDGDFVSQIFINNPHELWKRVLVGAIIIAFGFYAQQKFNERKQAEEAIRTSEAKYRTIFEDALNPIFLFSEKGPFLDCNQAALDFLECKREHLDGKMLWSLCAYSPMADRCTWYSPSGDFRNLETDFFVNGKTKTLLLNMVPMTSRNQTLVYGIGQDISERKQMELDIRMAHSELNHIFQTASAGMRLIDKNFTVMKVNETFASLSGISVEAAAGKKCYEVFYGAMCQKPACPLTRILNGKKEIDCEIEKQRQDGTKVNCLLTARPFLGPDGELAGIVESFNNITELKWAREELRSERDKLHRILFQRYEGVGIVNKDFIIEFQNDTLQSQIGDSKGKYCYNVLMERERPCKNCLMHSAIQSEEPNRFEFDASSGRSYELTHTPFTEADGENKAVITLRDITQIKSTRAAAIQSEQLAALGALAAGVAHEINNPINGIINYGQILKKKSGQKNIVKPVAERIVMEGDRIARIVEKLLSFARREKQFKSSCNISELLTDTLALTAAQMRKDAIKVKVNIPSNLPPVVAVAQEIQQVFLNLLNNSQYSLQQKFSGSRESKIIEINADSFSKNGSRWIKVSFFDSGTGIPKGIIDKVINPFFSTKPRGEGTGLGLSVSHGIISEHGGRISIKSVEGEYTRVDLELPVEITSQK